MPKTLDDLRDHLFATLDAMRDTEKPMDIDRAKAISEVAQTVINSARVEVDYVRALGRSDMQIPVFGAEKKLPPPPAAANNSSAGTGEAGVRTHRIK